MSFKKILVFTLIGIAILVAVISNFEALTDSELEEFEGKYKTDEPDEFVIFHQGIRTPEGASSPGYTPGYVMNELKKAKRLAQFRKSNAKTKSNGVIEWKERGPANVPGRTRAIAVVPTDPNKNTWFAGSSGGGIWKTTDGGTTWINKSPDFPTLAVSTIAICENTPSVMYAGTGEYIASVGTAIMGNGIFKSTDSGETWSQLSSTINSRDFISVTRIIVDPSNPNLVLACSAPDDRGDFKSTIMRSTNGGTSWTNVFEATDGGAIEQLVATPANFNILYAAQDFVGVLKSTDAGQTWSLSNEGMSPEGRVEIAVSPVNTNLIFASVEGSLSGSASDLYVSNNAGASWSLVNVSFNNSPVDFLGGQGWYDNTIACDPFNSNMVYFGGTSLFRAELTSGSSSVPFYTAKENDTKTFMTLTNFGADFYNGKIKKGPNSNKSVSIRFGTNIKQMAHRFLVPDGSTSGVSDANYTYTDYVEIPFQAWEIDENGNDIRQLMVSFRDQGRDGTFNLNPSDVSSTTPNLQSREYVYIHDVAYDDQSPNSNIAVNGGHVFNNIYFFWPVLSASATWTPNELPSSELKILSSTISLLNATTITSADVYAAYDAKNDFSKMGVDFHPDQHNLIMIPVTSSTYKILAANDGGVFISKPSATPGITEGDWKMAGKTYNTSQFYGVDKRPGYDQYFGGTQDNGTWQSPAKTNASSSTDYENVIGGDGFEVVWNNFNSSKMIGGFYENGFRRTTDGGKTWVSATTGLSGNAPFISKLANSKNNPDVLYAVSSSGVFRSSNFGVSWTLKPISEKWGASTFLDVEVSRADHNIVWAGSGMSDSRNLHVSINNGASFTVTNNFTDVTLGSITKLASHPTEPNTAYALFSFFGKPKILRTTNLGQSWEDISGFGTGNTSNNGFPDVAVYCLYVRKDNPDIIWAGTEIGIVESLDNGATWALLDEFINASVWDMKGQDDQIVIATHGRGIWTATVPEYQTEQITGLEDPKSKKNFLTLYPNPTSENLFINFELLRASETSVQVVDVFGRPVVSSNYGILNPGTQTKNIQLGNLPEGSYVVILKTNQGNKSGKISIQR